MSHEIHPIPTPAELKQKFPLLPQHHSNIEESRLEIRNVLDGHDPRFLLIAGPCSIHHTTAALEFASKLSLLAEELKDTFVVAMRVYYEKPRTCLGWKGLTNDPDLDGTFNIPSGLEKTRELLLDLCKRKIPVASEILDPNTVPYFEDLLSWGCIGARTSESQVHRQLASGLSIPIAFKNNTDGNMNIAVRGVVAATAPHSYIGIDESGTVCQMNTSGNPWSHIVLRGGENRPNYGPHAVAKALKILEKERLPQRLVIDCSHDNCFSDHTRQPVVFQNVIHQVCEGNTQIRGFILESYHQAGKQSHTDDTNSIDPRISITDACIDWNMTEALIRWAHHQIKQANILTPAPEILPNDLEIAGANH